jgi:plastocyanin
VTLSAGEYELACKPGQKGNGIRTKLVVTGTAAAPSTSASTAAFDREIEFKTEDYKYEGLEGFAAKVGEKIEFKLENEGAHQHELEITGPDGVVIGEVPPVDPGSTGEAIIEFVTPGTYTYKSGVADDADRGMKGSFVVT